MSASQSKGLKIPAMFAKVGSKPSTKCPVCQVPASLREINEHLNEGCPDIGIQHDAPNGSGVSLRC